jgi:hypothetical protein
MRYAPVITDLSPPSDASAAACAVRLASVPSQIALPLTAFVQEAPSHIGIVAKISLIHPIAGFDILIEFLRFGGILSGFLAAKPN